MTAKHIVLNNGIPRARDSSITVYEQTVVVGAPISAGTAITLPLGETYTGDDLMVFLNNVALETVDDFNFVGSAPRTQISLTFDAEIDDNIRFRKLS